MDRKKLGVESGQLEGEKSCNMEKILNTSKCKEDIKTECKISEMKITKEGSVNYNIDMDEEIGIFDNLNETTHHIPDVIRFYHSDETISENDHNVNDFCTEEVKLESDPVRNLLIEEEMLSSDDELLCKDISLSMALSDHNYISPRTNDLDEALLWLNATLSNTVKHKQPYNKLVTTLDQISNIINTLERVLGKCSPCSREQILLNSNVKNKIESLKSSKEIILCTDSPYINDDSCNSDNYRINEINIANIDDLNNEKHIACEDRKTSEEHHSKELNNLDRDEIKRIFNKTEMERKEKLSMDEGVESNVQPNINSSSEQFDISVNKQVKETNLEASIYENTFDNLHGSKDQTEKASENLEISLKDQTKLTKLLKFGENLVSCCNNVAYDKMSVKNLFNSIKSEFNNIFHETSFINVGVQTDYTNKPLFNEKQRIINEKEKQYLMKSSSGESDTSGDEFEENLPVSSFETYSSEDNLVLPEESVDWIESNSVLNELVTCDSLLQDASNNAELEKSNLEIGSGDNNKDIGDSFLSDIRSIKQDSVYKDAESINDEKVHEKILSRTNSSNSLAQDEKLKMEPLVVVEKLKDEDLSNYYCDLREKQIDRLLNFNNLEKRRICPLKGVSCDKLNSGSKYIKRRNSFNIPFEDDLGSDESSTEETTEVMTEKEYLSRCNESFKEHFLNTASSESDINSEQSACEGDISDSSFDSDTTPMVDKFLGNISLKNLQKDKDIVSAKTKYEEDNKKSSLPKCDNENTEIETHDEKLNSEEGIRCDEEQKIDKSSIGIENLFKEKQIDIDAIEKNLENSAKMGEDSEQSDCEILHSSALSLPRKEKSYDSLIAESDKRRKSAKITEELINLSSESASELEEIVNEDEFPKRVLKPMLRQHQLAGETRLAQKEEAERIKRLEKKCDFMAKFLKEHYNSLLDKERTKELILDYNSEKKEFIKVHSDIVKHLKAHQIDGVKFMYDTCYGSVEFLKKHPGSGCILAHCMGLGKTLQLIALLHTVISYKELKTSKVLVLCPKSTVMNWKEEIQRWLGPIQPQLLKVYCFPDASDVQEKLRLLQEWSTSGSSENRKAGCFLMGYEAFRTLVFYHLYKKQRSSLTPCELESIKNKVKEMLLQPGADLVICDEGHIIKNRKSAISTAVAEIKTLRRIILTGTPIQNNLKEYYSMVNFIKPSFLGTEREFANLYANPIRCGQHKDSSKKEIKIMKQRSFVLHKKLSKFVQRREAALLKSFLPDKYEYVLFIPMTNIQNTLYEFFLKSISTRDISKGKSLIPDYTCLRKIWTHPKVLENAWQNAVNGKSKRELKNTPTRINSDEEEPDDIYDSQTGALSVTRDWWRPLITNEDLESLLPSNKLRVMFEILRMCGESGEKCLIFSAFVAVLNVVEHFMQQIHAKDLGRNSHDISNLGFQKFNGPWIEGRDYYRLDGKTSKTMRHEMVKMFNNPENKRARCFLISAKAGGQGINLIGANRVIILDTSWNPSNDQQNIFRIFRLGQKRKCYVYRLLTMGTMEEKVYSRSVTKQAMSFRVVDEQQIDRHYSMAELAELYTLTIPNLAERPVPTRPKDNILASLLHNFPEMVFKYHEHDSLLENKLEQELSEQEKADAWAAYEQDLQSQVSAGLLPPPTDNLGLIPNPSSNYLHHFDEFTARNFPMSYNTGMPSASHLIASPYNYSSNAIMEMLNMYKNYTVPLSPFISRLPNMSHLNTSHHFPPSATPNLLSGNLSSNPNILPTLGNLASYNNLPSSSNALMSSTTGYSALNAISNGMQASGHSADSYKQLIEANKIGNLESLSSKNPKPQASSSESIPTSVITRSDLLFGKLRDFVESSERPAPHVQIIPQKSPLIVNPIAINSNKASYTKGSQSDAIQQNRESTDVPYLERNSANLPVIKTPNVTSLIDKTTDGTVLNGNITVRSVNSINNATNNSNYVSSCGISIPTNSVSKSALSYLGPDKSNTSKELNKEPATISVRKSNPFENSSQVHLPSTQSPKKNFVPTTSITTVTQMNTMKTTASPHLKPTKLLSVKPQTMVKTKQNSLSLNAHKPGESNIKRLLPSNSLLHSGKFNKSNSVRTKVVNRIENLKTSSLNFSNKQNFPNPILNNMRSKPIGIFNSNINKVNNQSHSLDLISTKKSKNQRTSNKNNAVEISNLQTAASCAALTSLSARSNLSIKPIENKKLVSTVTTVLPEHKNHTSISQSSPVISYPGHISLTRKESRKRPAPATFNLMLPENPPMSVRQIKRSKTTPTPSNNIEVRNTPETSTRVQTAQNLRTASKSVVNNNQRPSNESILNEDKVKLLYKSSLI